MIDHNFYASPVQASQTLITHILEAMDKELERPFTIALSGGTTPATLFEVWERELRGEKRCVSKFSRSENI